MAILSYEALQRRFESKPDLRDFLDTAYYWRTRPEPNKRQVSGKMQIDQPNTTKIVAGATNTSGSNGGQGATGLPGTSGGNVTNITIGEAVAAISLPLNQVAFGGGEGQPLRSNPLFMTVPDGDKLHVQIQNDILLGGDIRTGQDGFTIRQAGTDTVIFGPSIVNIRRTLQIGADPTEDAGGEGYDTVIWGDTFLKNSLIKPELPLFKRESDGLLYSRRLEEVEAPWTRGASVAAGTIMIGDPVAATGQDFGVLAMNTALAATPARSWMLGVSAEGGYPGEISGYVRRGPVEFDTQAFTGAAGSQLWLQPAGGLNTTKPSISNATRNVIAGTLLVKAELGKIYVDPVNFPFVHELSGVNAAAPADKHALMFSTATNRWEARAITSADLSGGPWLPLAAGPSSPLAGTLHGTSLNFSGWTADAPIAVAMNHSNAFAHAITVVNFGLTAGQRLTVDFGQSAFTNNQANFGFVYAGAGSTANKITLGLYGNNDLVTIAGTGVMTVRDLGTGFVRATSGALSASALVAADIPALDAGKITTGTFPDARIASSATWNGKLSTVTADTTSRAANTFYAAPNGTTGAATFRAIAVADVPTLNQNTTGSAAKWTTPRNLTIGASTQALDGTTALAFTLAAIGAAPAHSVGTNVVIKSNGSGGFAASTASDNGTLFVTTGRLGWDGGTLRDLVGDTGKTAIYGVLVPETASNYGLAVSKNGSEAWLNGSYASVLAASGAVVALATSSGLAIAGALSVSGTTTLASSLNGLLKATSGVVSAASSADLPGGPYLPLAAGSIHAPSSYSASGASLAIGDAQYGLSANGGTLYLWAAPGGSVVSPRSFTCLSGIYAAGSITSGIAQMSAWSANPTVHARFGHSSWNTAAGFGYLQASDGEVFLEAPTGHSIHLRINSPDVVVVSGSGVAVTGTLSVSGLSTLAGATITSANRLTITGGESSNIRTVYNNISAITINSPVSNASIRHAWSHVWYATDWQTGNIRGGGTDSAGYGITVDNNNLRWRVTNGTTYDYNALVVSGTLAWGGGGAIGSSANVVQGQNSTRTFETDAWTSALPSGFYQSSSAGTTPSGGWCHMIAGRYTDTGSNYQSQIATDFFNDRIWFRRIDNGSVKSWRELWHTGNLSPTVVGSLAVPANRLAFGNGSNGLTSSASLYVSSTDLVSWNCGIGSASNLAFFGKAGLWTGNPVTSAGMTLDGSMMWIRSPIVNIMGSSYTAATFSDSSIELKHDTNVSGNISATTSTASTSAAVGDMVQVAMRRHVATGGTLPLMGLNTWCFVTCDNTAPASLNWVTNSTQSVRWFDGANKSVSPGGGAVGPACNYRTWILIGPTISGSDVCTLIVA